MLGIHRHAPKIGSDVQHTLTQLLRRPLDRQAGQGRRATRTRGSVVRREAGIGAPDLDVVELGPQLRGSQRAMTVRAPPGPFPWYRRAPPADRPPPCARSRSTASPRPPARRRPSPRPTFTAWTWTRQLPPRPWPGRPSSPHPTAWRPAEPCRRGPADSVGGPRADPDQLCALLRQSGAHQSIASAWRQTLYRDRMGAGWCTRITRRQPLRPRAYGPGAASPAVAVTRGPLPA